jgi:transcriptional regulator with XRE-family HTH domain
MKNRIREARESRGFSAVDMAAKLKVHPSTLNNWEADRRQITPDKLVQLSEILGLTVDYLLGKSYPSVSMTEPVVKEALSVLHGQSVWSEAHGWMLVNIIEKSFVLENLSLIPFDEVSEPVYTIPPALSYSLRGVGHPLSLEGVLHHDRVWVEPITPDTDLAAAVRGWYSIYEKRLAQNEYGTRFYLDAYGAKRLAFADCVGKED